MSVQSVKNGILQLGELIISNERYSGATGYVASSSTFNAGVTGSSLAVDGSVTAHSFSTTAGGTSLFDNITVIDTLTIGIAPAIVELTGTAGELIVAGNVSASTFSTTNAGTSTFDDITAIGSVSAVSFSTTAAGTSTFDDITAVGTVSANKYTGGIGCLNQSISIPSISILGTYTVLMTISNFIGNASSVYVASLNESSLVGIPFTIGVSFSSVSGNDTIVIVVITNPSMAPPGGFSAPHDAYVNIIAMNP